MSAPCNRVLVIDDDEWIVKSTATVLEAEGFEVTTAASGSEGIDAARVQPPGVILLDIMMPGLDGWETLERLKTDEVTCDIPVVIFSAREVHRGREPNGDKGAAECVRKPFEPAQLVDVVRKHLRAAEVAEKRR